MKKLITLVIGATLGCLISSVNGRADDIVCYKENGEIEYKAGSPYHFVRVSSNAFLVSVYYLQLKKAWGDDIKKEILLKSFTHTRCSITYSEKKGLF